MKKLLLFSLIFVYPISSKSTSDWQDIPNAINQKLHEDKEFNTIVKYLHEKKDRKKENTLGMRLSPRKYEIAIIGSGPAGLTAGMYAARGKTKTVLFEGIMPGGQLINTMSIENWPGEISIPGYELMDKMLEQTEHHGADFVDDTVVNIDFSKRPFVLQTEDSKTYQADAIIIATGTSSRRLGVPGEDEYFGRGVATCTTCDAPFQKDKEVVVVGGGNSVLFKAEHLLKYVKKLTIIHSEETLRAEKTFIEKIKKDPRVTFLLNTKIKRIKGDGNEVTSIIVKNLQDKTRTELKTAAVFLALGYKPNTEFLGGQITLDNHGYIKAIDETKTNIDGVFCAGNVVDCKYHQAMIASAQGCKAALDAQVFLSTLPIN